VLLPVYNERENLPLMVAMLDRSFASMSPAPSWEVVVVEDASPDGTLAVARALQACYGAAKVVVVARPGKLGLGTAYVDGLRVARGKFIFIMDADMSHHVRARRR
jgi:dolichol-phosphate mannosyltransferase